MSINFDACPFCGGKAGATQSQRLKGGVAFDVHCSRCGHFGAVSAVYFAAAVMPVFERTKIAMVLRELNLCGADGYQHPLIFRREKDIPPASMTFSLGLDTLQSMCPKSVDERVDRALRNMARLSGSPGSVVKFDLNSFGLLYAENPPAAGFLLRKLKEDGYIQADRLDLPADVLLTPKGWERVELPEKPKTPAEKPEIAAEKTKPASFPSADAGLSEKDEAIEGSKSSRGGIKPFSPLGAACAVCEEGIYERHAEFPADARNFGLEAPEKISFVMLKCSSCGHAQFFCHETGRPPAWDAPPVGDAASTEPGGPAKP